MMGGRTREDRSSSAIAAFVNRYIEAFLRITLLDFKSKFSPLKANFYVGGMVHDRDAFAALGGRKGTFFLSYRQAQAS